jgi:hypothetical protein
VKRAWWCALVAVLAAAPALAQEHWTEGPVWSVAYYRTKPGKFDEYLRYLRGTAAVSLAESKKAGLLLDYKVLVNSTLSGEGDWDVALAELFPSYGKALDFDAKDDEKAKELAAKRYKTPDREKQREAIAPRFLLRDLVMHRYMREVTLKPLP